ncbi:MAG: peptidylprolyl isomerase [Bacteroidales bacterium]|nr:peptidylprolyl isomerase [Bacteroidales bacterium]
MKKYIVILPLILFVVSCAVFKPKAPVEQKVLIEANQGKIVVKLYNETPKHRENFLKWVDTAYYDSLLFHRVIDDFMIQAGDPESKNAEKNARLGNGGPGYTVEAEIVSGKLHKRGALAAARQADDVNPEKRSSGSQFYIVEGSLWTDSQLDLLIKRRNSYVISDYINRLLKEPGNETLAAHVDSLRRNQHRDEFNELYLQLTEQVMPQIKADSVDMFDLSEAQRNLYKTVGGSPHLDGEYTVFGEVVLGMPVVETISDVKTDIRNRPLEDVLILSMKKLSEKEFHAMEKQLNSVCP